MDNGSAKKKVKDSATLSGFKKGNPHENCFPFGGSETGDIEGVSKCVSFMVDQDKTVSTAKTVPKTYWLEMFNVRTRRRFEVNF